MWWSTPPGKKLIGAHLDPSRASLGYCRRPQDVIRKGAEPVANCWRNAQIGLGLLCCIFAFGTSSVDAAVPVKEPRIVQFARPGSPEATVQAALVAGLEADESKGFEAYLALVHPSRKGRSKTKSGARRKGKSRAIELIRRYSWKRFKSHVKDYVLPESTGGFTLVRMDPPTLIPSTRFVRIFVAPVNNPHRSIATPIRLERSGEQWLITANSL
jgi:hypothetical protein